MAVSPSRLIPAVSRRSAGLGQTCRVVVASAPLRLRGAWVPAADVRGTDTRADAPAWPLDRAAAVGACFAGPAACRASGRTARWTDRRPGQPQHRSAHRPFASRAEPDAADSGRRRRVRDTQRPRLRHGVGRRGDAPTVRSPAGPGTRDACSVACPASADQGHLPGPRPRSTPKAPRSAPRKPSRWPTAGTCGTTSDRPPSGACHCTDAACAVTRQHLRQSQNHWRRSEALRPGRRAIASRTGPAHGMPKSTLCSKPATAEGRSPDSWAWASAPSGDSPTQGLRRRSSKASGKTARPSWTRCPISTNRPRLPRRIRRGARLPPSAPNSSAYPCDPATLGTDRQQLDAHASRRRMFGRAGFHLLRKRVLLA